MSPAINQIEQRPPRRPVQPVCLGAASDSDLLEAWGRDSHAPALAALVERYSVMVLSVCRRRCRSEADAEDAYQTTFLYLARNSQKIRRPECLAGWLQRVAQRAATATLSASKRETEPMVEPPSDPDDPLDRLTQRHEVIVLDEELSELPEHYRAAIVMHCYEDRPLQLLAEHFGTTVGSIRGRLQRGKQLLAQRLRRRGVVPVVAFAAANAWTVSPSQAAAAAEQFTDQTAGDLPDPPIDTPLLESLLSQGVRLMPSFYAAVGLIGGSALIASMMSVGGDYTPSSNPQDVVTMPREVLGQFGTNTNVVVQPVEQAVGGGGEVTPASGGGASPAGGSMGMGTAAMGVGGAAFQADPFATWTRKAVLPTPSGPIAKESLKKMESEITLDISSKLTDLPNALGETLGVPVLLDDRGIAFAKQQGDTAVQFTGQQPLRTALRTMLRPLGLKAVIEEEGIVITADPSALVHQGIGINRWINIDEDAERAITEMLDTEVKLEFVDMPLQDVVDQLRELHELRAIIDARSLEEIGLSIDQPISFFSENTSLRNAIALMLRDQELTYTIQGESLVITTEEAAEHFPISRIYWLEGTGYADTDFDSVMETIQTSIAPDSWEAMGGPFKMVPLGSTRPALVISTCYTIHESIESFFEVLRESHFGAEPVLERVQVPAATGGMGGGGFGGGMGGMGGGGMF